MREGARGARVSGAGDLHHDVDLAGRLVALVELDAVGVVERLHDVDLSAEAVEVLREPVLADDLDGHHVAALPMPRPLHLGVRALTKHCLDLVHALHLPAPRFSSTTRGNAVRRRASGSQCPETGGLRASEVPCSQRDRRDPSLVRPAQVRSHPASQALQGPCKNPASFPRGGANLVDEQKAGNLRILPA